MEKFEYKTVVIEAEGFWGGKINKTEFKNELNELGSQGWELVSVVPSAQAYGKTKWFMSVFKRRLD